MAFDPKSLGAVLNIGRIATGKVAFGETEIVDGIEEIRLAYAIAPAYPHDSLGKLIGLMKIVLELEKPIWTAGKETKGVIS